MPKTRKKYLNTSPNLNNSRILDISIFLVVVTLLLRIYDLGFEPAAVFFYECNEFIDGILGGY